MPGASAQTSTADQWSRWEQAITSKKVYVSGATGNPYKDLTLVATYRLRSTGATFTRRGFWDGGTTFRIRAAFPPGTWDWTTSCTGITAGKSCAEGETPATPSDSGLNRSGTVTVGAVTVNNALYDRLLLPLAAGLLAEPRCQGQGRQRQGTGGSTGGFE